MTSTSPPHTKPLFKIALIPGDGIGIEVIAAGRKVLECLIKATGSFNVVFEEFDWGSELYLRTGSYIPEGGLERIRNLGKGEGVSGGAVLFGAVGNQDVPDHISLWGLRLAICQGLQQYANVRPTRVLRGTTSPLLCLQGEGNRKKLDWVIVRENSEGEYAGHGGTSHRNQSWAVATEVSIFTRHGCERIMRFAFETARKRPKRHLTVVTKSNAQRNGMVFWDQVAKEVAKEFPDVHWDKELVDAMTVRMVTRPESLDTIVATNLHADILSDLAAALAGSIGIAPTSNLDPEGGVSMFEPIHGSAWDIAGKGVANPVGTFWCVGECVRWLGGGELEGEADLLMEAVERTMEGGVRTVDLGGNAGTADVTERVCEEIGRLVGEREGLVKSRL